MKRLLLAFLLALTVALPASATAPVLAAKPTENTHKPVFHYICHLQLEYDADGVLIEAKYKVLRLPETAWAGHESHAVRIGDEVFTDEDLGPVSDFDTRPKASDACPDLPDLEPPV